MRRYLALLALLAATLIGGVAAAARAVGVEARPPGWETALRGLTAEPPSHALLGPISATGRTTWDCWPQREAESPVLDPVFPEQGAAPSEAGSPRP